MEEKTLHDEQYSSEEQQETKGYGDSTECGWMQGIPVLALSDLVDCRAEEVPSRSNFWRRRRQANQANK